MKTKFLLAAFAAGVAALPVAAGAQSIVNGGFETGSASGWTQGNVNRTSITNSNLDRTDFAPGNSRSSIIAAGTVDPIVGASLGSTVYSGNYSFRMEDTFDGGYGSLLEQRVNNYADANIFFAWKAVLESAHDADQSATFKILLRDLTDNTILLSRNYNQSTLAGAGSPFSYNGTYYYTANWQIENLALGASQGHDILLSIIAADCLPSAHLGYAYIDGFGAVTPPAGPVPEPATWAMMLMGFGAIGTAMRRRRIASKVRFA